MALALALASLLTLTLASNSLAQQPTLPIGIYPIPKYVESQSNGWMIDYFQRLQAHLNWQSTLEMDPIRRTQRRFKAGELIGYFPELEQFRPPGSCRTSAFATKHIYAHTLSDRPAISDIKQLQDLKIVAINGYSYGKNLVTNPSLDIQYVDNSTLAIRMLLAGRVDVMLEEGNGTYAVAQSLGVTHRLHHDPQAPLNSLEVFFVFQGSPEGIKLCRQLSSAIEAIPFKDIPSQWAHQ